MTLHTEEISVIIRGYEMELSKLIGRDVVLDLRYKPPYTLPADIMEFVSNTLSIDLKDLVGTSRRGDIQDAARIATKILRDNTVLSLKGIGELFGCRDHTTIINRLKRHNDLAVWDKQYARKYKMCEIWTKIN